MRARGSPVGLMPMLLLALLAYSALAQQRFLQHSEDAESFEPQLAKLEVRDAQGGYEVPTNDHGPPPPYYSEPPPYYPPPEPTESLETSSETCE